MLPEVELKKWGNSTAIRLPRDVLAQAQLKASDRVEVSVQKGSIILKPVRCDKRKIKLPFTEAQLLDGLDAHGAHVDELAEPMPSELGD